MPILAVARRFDQTRFGRGQNALEPDHEKIINQMRADVAGVAGAG